MAIAGVRGRTWAMGVLAAALAVALCLVGAWQWRVAVHREALALPADPAVPIAQLVPTGQPLATAALAREVTARGTYDPAGTLLVTGRSVDGRAGSWLLVPLRTDGGGVLPVVRGFLPVGAPAPQPPSGIVTVRGRVQPPFRGGSPAVADGAASGPSVAGIDTAALVNQWGGPIHPAYVLAEDERPTPSSVPTRVPAAPLGTGTTIQLRNLAYALQWFAFAGFVLLLWGRLVRDDVRSARDASDDRAPTGTAPPAAPACPREVPE